MTEDDVTAKSPIGSHGALEVDNVANFHGAKGGARDRLATQLKC